MNYFCFNSHLVFFDLVRLLFFKLCEQIIRFIICSLSKENWVCLWLSRILWSVAILSFKIIAKFRFNDLTYFQCSRKTNVFHYIITKFLRLVYLTLYKLNRISNYAPRLAQYYINCFLCVTIKGFHTYWFYLLNWIEWDLLQ
jgi:hypothetical protein